MSEPEFMTRRRFFCALAASVVVVGLPLPVGLTEKDVWNCTLGFQNRTVTGWCQQELVTFVWAKWEDGNWKITGLRRSPMKVTSRLGIA